MELKDWPILKPLKSYFLKTVRAALVFGNGGSEALLVTRDNCVYGIGTNLAGHLGLGDESPRTTITEIPTLSGKGVGVISFHFRISDISASYLFDFIVVLFKQPNYNNTSTVYGPTPITIREEKYFSLFEFYGQRVSFMQQTMFPPEIHRILRDFTENAFENQKYCDMIIEVDGKEFHVHRAILMMRSKYFETIISRWLDPKINVCSIKKKSPAVIEAYLKYIYTDNLDVDLSMATDLLLLADEYDDEDFKVLCKQVIEQKMTVDNVVELYPLVYRMRNVEDLIDRSIEIVASKRSHLETIVNSDGYKNWNPEMLQMFLPRYAKKRRLNNAAYDS